MCVALFSLTVSKCLHLICLHLSLAVTGDEGITLVSLLGHLHYLCLTVIDQVHEKAGEIQEMIKILLKREYIIGH